MNLIKYYFKRINYNKYINMTAEEFCKFHNEYHGESGMMSGIDNPKQLTQTFTGEELKEFMEAYNTQVLEDIKKEIQEIKTIARMHPLKGRKPLEILKDAESIIDKYIK